MAIKNYIIQNRKKTICIFSALMAVLITLFVAMYVKHANAGVFVEDEEGNNVQINEIKVLEIVARNGQQVLGYTVEGQEPITIEKIESYVGTMNLDVDDFKDATGYDVSKIDNGDGTFRYKVNGSELNHTFNETVLGDSMAVGEIQVKAIQANNLTSKDIEWADLIYINSKDNNSNLLYYYDQFMNDGSMGIESGDMGESFNDTYLSEELVSALSMKRICQAAGDKLRAAELTDEDFATLDLENYQSHNLAAYKTALIALEYDALTGSTEDETLDMIDAVLESVNTSEQTAAIAYIQSKAGLVLTAEEETEFLNAFVRGGWSNYIPLNDDKYVSKISEYKHGINVTSIGAMLDTANGAASTEALEALVSYKTRANNAIAAGTVATETTDEYGFTPEDYSNLGDLFVKSNQGEIKEELYSKYFEAFLAEDFEYTASDSTKIRTLIQNVNNENVNAVLTELADCVGNTGLIDTFAEDASKKFAIVDIDVYNKYYLDAYIDGLYNLTDTNAFKDADGNVDLAKITTYLEDVNNSSIYRETTLDCDMTWRTAKVLYDAAMDESVALMYNTELLTGKTIGDYQTDLSALVEGGSSDSATGDDVSDEETGTTVGETIGMPATVVDNTNNVYKMLLLLRQIQGTYYTNNLAANIDTEGTYYPDGIDATTGEYIGTGISSWYMETFGNDFTKSDGSVYCEKYHEPEVVGQTYSETGVEGNPINYVYKRIYSFTGDQFFGGAKFLAAGGSSTADIHKVITAGTGYQDSKMTESTTLTVESTDYIIIDVSQYSAYQNKTIYAHFWNSSGAYSQTFVQCEKVAKNSSGKYYLYKLAVPEGYNQMLLCLSTSWSNQTSNFSLGDDYVGKRYYVVSGPKLKEDTSGSNNYYLGGITNSIQGGTVYYNNTFEMKIWGFNIGTATNHAEYELYVGDKAVYSGYDNGVHYTEGYIDGDTCQPFKIGEKIKILDSNTVQVGDDVIELYESVNNGGVIQKGNKLSLDNGNELKLVFRYNSSTTTGSISYTEQTYKYVKNYEKYKIDVSNIINGGTVEYAGYMNVGFDYTGIDYVKYSLNGASYVNVASGENIIIGNEYANNTSTSLTVKYKPTGESEKTVTTTLKKVSISELFLPHYKSVFTANNSAMLANDDTLSYADNTVLTNANKGEVIRYLLGVTITEVTFPMTILEIQPAAAVTELDSYAGAKKIAEYMNISVPGMTEDNYSDYFDVTYMSVKEFNTRNEDLTAKYDLIYFGVDSGYQVLKGYTANGTTVYRTKYNDTSMTGYVYMGIGDKYTIQTHLMGVAASDYSVVNYTLNTAKNGYYSQSQDQVFWKNYFFGGFQNATSTGQYLNNSTASWDLDSNKIYQLSSANGTQTTRLGGNDITVKRMEDLLSYLKAGYPILLADEIMYCDDDTQYIDYDGVAANAAKWRYVGKNSKMYNFVIQAKKLGYDETSGTYTGKYVDSTGTEQNVFLDGKTYPSLISVSYAKDGKNPDNLSDAEKLNGGLSYAYKRISRVEFSFKSGPTQYNKDSYGDRLANGSTGNRILKSSSEYKSYKIVLDIESGATLEQLENYAYQMYVDKSGVGKFEEENTISLDPDVEYVKDESGKATQVIISGNWPGNMEGFIPWKVEAYNVDNPELKFSYVGCSAFETVTGAKKDVYVLWIRTTYNTTKPYNLDFVKALQDYSGEIDDYNIHLMSMTYAEFIEMWKSETAAEAVDFTYTAETSKLKVNTVLNHMSGKTKYYYNMSGVSVDNDKELDMLVLGFSDSYSGLDIASIPALKNIDYFLDAGHSLLFSHDNSSYLGTVNCFTGNNSLVSSSSRWGRYTTAYLRNLLGMDMFGITTSSANLSESAINARKYIDSTNQQDYRGIAEMCAFHYVYNRSGNKLYSATMHGTSAKSINDWCHTNLVMKVNSGQITEYPFVLDDELDVSLTHSQYMTLDLEDEDTTVWYVLDDDGKQKATGGQNPRFYTFTKGDGTNNYYIYSNGNITYTGAGHSSTLDSSVNEKKLFINTVVAALKAGNYEPEVELPNAYKSSDGTNCINYYTDAEGVVVEIKPIDYDKKDNVQAFTDCKIFVDVDGSGNYTEGKDLLLNDPDEADGSVGSSYLYDIAGTDKINYRGQDLLNRQTVSFLLKEAEINAALPSGKTIFDYNIFVQVSDQGNNKSKNPVPATASNSFKLVRKDSAKLFNLN